MENQTTYAKFCPAHRRVDPLEPGAIPPLGAHLVTPWLGYTHHGIHAGEGRVVQYGALKYDCIRKPVEEVSMADFAQGRAVFVVTHSEAGFEPHEIIGRARSRLGEKRYRLFTNNCEHFVEWCLHGVHRSFEVEIALNFPRWFGERLLARVWQLVRPAASAASVSAPVRIEPDTSARGSTTRRTR
jgi:hypothetical protein